MKNWLQTVFRVVELDIIADLTLKFYRNHCRPTVLNERHFDLRAEMIASMIKSFKTSGLAAIIPEAVFKIVADLQELMPTAEQIAASRDGSTQRFVRLSCQTEPDA